METGDREGAGDGAVRQRLRAEQPTWRAVPRPGAGSALLIAGLGLTGLLAIATVVGPGWRSSLGGSDSTAVIGSVALGPEVEETLRLLELDDVAPELRGASIFFTGSVNDDAGLRSAMGAAAALAGAVEVDTSELTVGESTGDAAASPEGALRDATLQRELSRRLAATPLVFDTGQDEPSELQARILDNVVALLLAYPEASLRIVVYNDSLGADANQALSVARAEVVRAYLIGQGVAPDRLTVQGDASQSGSSGALAGLERRVELEVASSGGR